MGQGRWRESLRSRKGLLFSFSPFCLFLLLPPFLPHFERAVGSGEGRSPLLSSVYCEPLGVDLAWRSGQEAWVHTTLSLTPFPSSPPAPSRLPPPLRAPPAASTFAPGLVGPCRPGLLHLPPPVAFSPLGAVSPLRCAFTRTSVPGFTHSSKDPTERTSGFS